MPNDNKPETDPALSIDAGGAIGRVYRSPIDEHEYALEEIPEALYNGHLYPSITNVLNVRNMPYLQQWVANKVAKEAVRVGQNWPEKYRTEPIQAERYLKSLHTVDLSQAAQRGTNVHAAMEALALGGKVPNTLTEDERKCVIQGEKFLSDFNPTFKHVELTGFGETRDGLKYAGTTDFVAEIENATVAGDYKCTTLNTPVLMADGTQKVAKDIREGDKIVAWTPTKHLHIAKVSWTADNGIQDIIKLRTEHGQTLYVTKEHPILVIRDKGIDWVQASEVRYGDIAHLAAGWNHNPNRPYTEWAYRVSPYAVGVVWSIINNASTGHDKKGVYTLPETLTETALQEIKLLGMKVVDGKVTREDIVTVLSRGVKEGQGVPLLELLDSPNIPDAVFATDLLALEGFLAGVREVFMNRVLFPNDYRIALASLSAVESLQQLFLNLGITTHRGAKKVKLVSSDPAEELVIRVPKIDSDYVFTHGPVSSKIVDAELIEAEPTIAIEVEGSHTHITAGIITHNTTRSGIHSSVAVQLNAFARTTLISPDDKTLIATPHIDRAVAVHLSPKAYEVVEVELSDEVFEVFESLRKLWLYHVFDGDLRLNENVLQSRITKPQDLRV